MIYIVIKYGRSPRTIATRLGVLEVLRELGHLVAEHGNYIKFPTRINGFSCDSHADPHIVVTSANAVVCENDIVEIRMAAGVERYYLRDIRDLFPVILE